LRTLFPDCFLPNCRGGALMARGKSVRLLASIPANPLKEMRDGSFLGVFGPDRSVSFRQMTDDCVWIGRRIGALEWVAKDSTLAGAVRKTIKHYEVLDAEFAARIERAFSSKEHMK
jgi:hypothetical protein